MSVTTQLRSDELCREFGTDSVRGLTNEEAKNHFEKYGPNQLPEAKRISEWQLFRAQFQNFIVWVLIGAALIAGFLGEWIDASAIGIIVILNAVLGFIQESHAEKSLQALRKLSSPTSKVIREGILQTIASKDIVPGDLILLEAGDRIPADGRVVMSVQMRTQEAALTGESVPVGKIADPISGENVPIGDRKNMVFMGTVVVSGKGRVVVTGTGIATELGKIAQMLEQATEESTPLKEQLEKLGQKLVYICLGIVAVVFALGLFRGNPFIEMILTAVSLAVAAIPEGLPAVVTMALAIGVTKMAKRNALIRRLPSVETLGCASVICTDKTGTLTQNEMTVRTIWVNGSFIDVTGVGYSPEGKFEKNGQAIDLEKSDELSLALKIGALCNSANLLETKEGWQISGDPTEGALLCAAAKCGFSKEILESENPLHGEIPFDSDRKRMSVLRNTPEGPRVFVKGAPDVLLNKSTHILMEGGPLPISSAHQKLISDANVCLAAGALRVLAVAYREVGKEEALSDKHEDDLTFVGLIAMMDPPRLEAKQAIATCKKAGIRTVMITGDHKETAIAVARELGLLEEDAGSVNGKELDEMSDDDLKRSVEKISVYARVSAEHKLRIVKAWKKNGAIVAMTGDGVNDAPAIKEANIGIAMGITGTDVTKEASDMVITDDNFASIVNAVEEGRGIYDNIVKFVNYLLSSNIAEILIIFLGILLGFKDPQGNAFISLSAVQLLWMNLVTDGLPALALGLDPLGPKAMERPPRKSSEQILSLKFGLQLFTVSLVIAAGTLVGCHYGLRQSAQLAQTMALSTLVVLELVRVQMVRSQYHIGLFSNHWLIAALLSSLLLQLVIVYTGFGQKVFGMVPLGISEWVVILIIAFAVWIAGSVINLLFSMRRMRL